MASRPFASINVALETDEEPPDLIGGSIKVRAGASGHSSPPLTRGIEHNNPKSSHFLMYLQETVSPGGPTGTILISFYPFRYSLVTLGLVHIEVTLMLGLKCWDCLVSFYALKQRRIQLYTREH